MFVMAQEVNSEAGHSLQGCRDCESSSSHSVAAGGSRPGGNVRRAQLEAAAAEATTPPPGKGADPARPSCEGRPPGRIAASGRRQTVLNPPAALLPAVLPHPRPGPGPHLDPPQAQPDANTPRQPRPVDPGRRAALVSRGGRPRLTSSRLRRRCRNNNSFRRPRPTRHLAL
ncbi:basic salivary proline-rich protein 3-like [Piliocolobus tephrosceles]|uniref:basic salivary proline-rich protein 3-like n=1 Tax=Piliocolobus tephrosceles TaxID=591936 RepID=UPI000C2A4237|nr:basic salivary proline-rich protein 3-like [Piliocolobus tephrosceles]